MPPLIKTNDKQDLLQKVYDRKKGTLPAKSISWRWDPTLREDQATEAVITYNRQPVGTINLDHTGEFQGKIEVELQALDGSRETISVSTFEGFGSISSVGNQLYYKFKRACMQAGYHWPW